jgi:hypothetical protein
MSNKRPRYNELKLTDLPHDVLNNIMRQVPQLRFICSEFYNKSKGWKLPAGAQYPSLTNENMMCVIHTQNSFSGQVILSPEQYFNDNDKSKISW